MNKSMRFAYTIQFIVFATCLLLLCVVEVQNIRSYTLSSNYQITVLEYIYANLSSGANISYSAILFMLFLGDLDLWRTPYKQFGDTQVIRNLIICFIKSFIMVALIAVFTCISSLQFARKGNGWSELALISEGLIERTVVPLYIIANTNPVEAALVAFLIVFPFFFSSALFHSIMVQLKVPYLGIMVYVAAVEWNSIWLGEYIPPWVAVRYYTLNALLTNTQKGNELFSIFRGVQYSLIFLVAMLIISCVVTRHMQKTTPTALQNND